jgi:hypothetical protein
VIVVIGASRAASAACMNKYIAQKEEGSKYLVTILTGKLSYPEAYDIARAVNDRTAAPPEWVDDRGKTILKHFGEMKVIRPMPVACDGKSSGVVLTLNFLAPRPPSGRIHMKFDEKTVIELDQQDR